MSKRILEGLILMVVTVSIIVGGFLFVDGVFESGRIDADVIKRTDEAFVSVRTLLDMKGKAVEGSGSVVDHGDESSYVLTAHHICHHLEHQQMPASVFPVHMVQTSNRHVRASVVRSNPSYDLCLLETDRLDVQSLELSDHVNRYDRVFTLSSPNMTHINGSMVVYEGRLLSKEYPYQVLDRTHRGYLYSIPVEQGSSGSPVLNVQGQLIGMISAYPNDVHHASVGPALNQIKQFLESSQEDHP